MALTNFYEMYLHSKLDEIQDKRGMYFSFDFGWDWGRGEGGLLLKNLLSMKKVIY